MEKILYYEAYIVLDPGDTDKKAGDMITEEEYVEFTEQNLQFKVGMGAVAVKELLKTIDINGLSGASIPQISSGYMHHLGLWGLSRWARGIR